MKVGAIFPQTEIGGDPIGIRDYVQAVEVMGFTHLLIYDHVLGAEDVRQVMSVKVDYASPLTPLQEGMLYHTVAEGDQNESSKELGQHLAEQAWFLHRGHEYAPQDRSPWSLVSRKKYKGKAGVRKQRHLFALTNG